MVTIEIDGRTIEAEKGEMLIDAADKAGIYIPRFCYHKHLSVAANCRMCLVEVEKAPKPMPACATPVADGMKVFTKSEKAVAAQKGTMEFLLINHPLDCPICDQGGECDLQDLAVGYGGDQSRYHESKRVVSDPDLGPLIATEMTRCIHCTRCVRFTDEIAGIQELGATGRGEHMKIGTYVQKTVNSELSGNVIDLCPVGALTSKPFQFEARSWEMRSTDSVSPHDCTGTPIQLQTLRGELKRVLPIEDPEINECWLSDRDRFSYEAVIGQDRLLTPRIRQSGKWQETDWRGALEFVSDKLKEIDGSGLAGIASPTCSTEELYLFQKLVRGLGSDDVDCRLKLADASDDDRWQSAPWFGMPIENLDSVNVALLIGTNLRKEQPIINHRLRKAALDGAKVSVINPVDFEFNYPLSEKIISSPMSNLHALANIVMALATEKGIDAPAGVAAWTRESGQFKSEKAIAKQLAEADASKVIVLGQLNWMSTQGSTARALAASLAEIAGATLAYLPEANEIGGWTAGCMPMAGEKQGQPAQSMFDGNTKAFLLMGTEPELDCADTGSALNALKSAELVVSLTEYASANESYAHVQLPRGAFAEISGTYINCEGKAQTASAASQMPGEAREGWKILRALAEAVGLGSFGYNSVAEIAAELPNVALKNPCYGLDEIPAPVESGNGDIDLECVTDSLIYSVDPTVRRSEPLQNTADNLGPSPRLNSRQIEAMGVEAGEEVQIHAGEQSMATSLIADDRVPEGCVYLPIGYAETSALPRTSTLRLVKG